MNYFNEIEKEMIYYYFIITQQNIIDYIIFKKGLMKICSFRKYVKMGEMIINEKSHRYPMIQGKHFNTICSSRL
jgi:hypothetical protein